MSTRNYCSDIRYESIGIFVLGVGFFFFRNLKRQSEHSGCRPDTSSLVSDFKRISFKCALTLEHPGRGVRLMF